MSRRLASLLWLAGAAACAPADAPPPAGSEPPAAAELLVDATAGSGVDFVHDSGATEDRLLPETMGSGVAVFDYDGDGWSDLFFVNGAPRSAAALYRNLGGWAFEERAARAGAAVRLVGMGAAAGDVDGDGATDLFISGVGGDRLLRNRGDGAFEDAGELIGDLAPGFGSSAAFLDADGDGWLDLFVGRYVTWSEGADVACRPDGVHRSYCTPEVYPGASNRLLRNRGAGRGFADVTVEAGLYRPEGKSLGVVPLDYDRDGRLDLAIANDTERNFLFVNRGGGRFEERGVELGVAFSGSGAPRGGMGIDAGDLFDSGSAAIVIGNFAQEMSALFRFRPGGLYTDDAAQLGIGLPSLLTLAFGTLIVDADLDGWNDVVLANGHIEPDIERLRPDQSYAQPMQLFRRVAGEPRFEPAGGAALATPRVGRGLASADLDGDGDPDLVLTQNGRPAVLLRNEGAAGGWLGLRLWAGRQGSAAYGARATLSAGGRRQSATLVSGRSYLSSPEPSLVFGLGSENEVEQLEIAWPGGRRARIGGLEAGRTYVFIAAPAGAAEG